jgi:hypothetical protein
MGTPATTTHFDPDACRDQLAAAVGATTDAAVLDALVGACREPEQSNLESMVGSWVVRNDDLDLFKPVASGLGVLVGLLFPGGAVVAATVIGLAIDLLDAARKARAKAVHLTDGTQLVVLRATRKHPGLTTAELTAALNDEAAEEPWTEAEVTAALGALGEANTGSGFVKLVEADTKGRWFARV